MLGPPTDESARLPWRSEFASRYCSRGTIETNRALYETKNRTVNAPVTNATTYSCQIVNASSA